MIFHQPFNSLGNYSFNTATYTNEIWNYHFHKNLELIWVLEGSVVCTINGDSQKLTANELALCLPYDTHRYEPEDNTRYWVLVFSEDYVRFFAKQIADKQAPCTKFVLDSALATYVKNTLIDGNSPSLMTLKSCLYGICEAYLRVAELTHKSYKDTESFASITTYIREHHTEHISLADVAKEAGYDYNYMSRYFKKRFHMSFSDFVNAYRIETAVTLLEDTRKSIAAISYESGFQSVRTFNAFFKKQMGQSPSEYRHRQAAGLIKATEVAPRDRHLVSIKTQ